ncbi:MAG: TolC family outer membrane protein [Alteromonadaceae bacterium]|nr:TolC family outer membrane protein [Alteromonadaceae bacterium]
MRAMPVISLRRLLGSTFVLAMGVGGASQVTADRLDAVVGEALERNPEVKFEARALDALKSEKRQEQGGYLPRVDLSAAAGRADRDFDSRGSFDRHNAEISVTQMLFDGFAVRSSVEIADQKVREQYFQLVSKAEDMALEVTRAYLEVKKYRHLVTLAEQNVENHLQVREQVQQRSDQGVGSGVDFNQAQGRLALARSNLKTERSNLQSVSSRFQRLVGKLPGSSLSEVNNLNQPMPQSLETLLNEVYSNNPEIHAAFANIESAEAGVDAAKANNYPTVELGLSHGAYKNNNAFDSRTDPDSFGEETLVELRLNYNLYKGGSDSAARKAAWQRVGQAQSLRDKSCVDLRQTASIAWFEMHNLREKLELLEGHQVAAAQVVKAYQQQFDIGRRSLLDVLDAENESFQAERSLVHGQYDLLLTRAELFHSMGQLLSVLSLSPKDLVNESAEETGSQSTLPAQYCAAATKALAYSD